MPSSRLFSFLLLLALFLQCTTDDAPSAKLNILFVGNSLTYENNLPDLVYQIASKDGIKLSYRVVAYGNYSFDDHLADGAIQTMLKEGKYDFLVGQQGPSALPESQVLLRESSIKIAGECESSNTTFALYMVWPSLARDFDRENCIASYTNAAKASNALLCPAGLAWKLAWQKDPQLPLYGPDNFHPSIQGSLLAAMVIYASIQKKKDLEFITRWKDISDDELNIMKEAAIKAKN